MKFLRGKKALAGVLALTLFLSSAFFVMYKYDVFGAVNKTEGKDSPNPYVNEGSATSTTVGVRGTTTNGTIMLTDEGSNVQGKPPAGKYEPWSPYKTLLQYKSYIKENYGDDVYNSLMENVLSLGKDYVVPGTYDTEKETELIKEINEKNTKEKDESKIIDIDDELSKRTKKGGEFNPFVLLEVVPDKAMQELTYFAGSQESGLPFDEGYLSATMMKTVREKNNSNVRFITNDIPNLKNQLIVGDGLGKIFGNWTVNDKYSVFQIGNGTNEDYAKEEVTLLDYNSSVATTKKQGSFDINEIYNFDITTDDLLKIDAVNKVITEDEYGNKLITYPADDYSKYVIAMATNPTDSNGNLKTGNSRAVYGDSDNDCVKYFIDHDLADVHLDNRKIYSDTKGGYTTHITSINKYNLTQPFLHANYIYANDFFKNGDVAPSADGGSMDVTYSRLGRASTNGDGSGYWKVRFRKYYVDHFEELYERFLLYDLGWKCKIWQGKSNAELPDTFATEINDRYGERITKYINENKQPWWEPTKIYALNIILNDEFKKINVNNYNNMQADALLSERDKKIQSILKQYGPLLEDKGVVVEAVEDYMDWEAFDRDMLSEVRTYQSEPRGGYVLAVKPGMGDMYLVTDEEKIKEMGGKGDEIVFARDRKAPTFNSDGTLKEKGDDSMRWIHVPSSFALNGYYPSGGQAGANEKDRYQAGYTDDSRYTNGFASKTVKNKNDMWLAIFDRYNHKYHGAESGFDTFSKKMFDDTNQLGVWATNNGTVDDIASGKVYQTYKRTTNDSIDNYHLNVVQQMFGSLPHWNNIRTLSAIGLGYGTVTDPKDVFSNLGDGNKDNDGIIDGEDAAARKAQTNWILGKDNLINSDGKGFFTGGDEKGTDWLFKDDISSSKYITGLCFNFADFRYSGLTNTGDPADIYNRDVLNKDGYTYHTDDYYYTAPNISPYVQSFLDVGHGNLVVGCQPDVHIGPHDEAARLLEVARYKDGDEAVLVDREQVVTEKVKKYHFTYYGFGANDILKRSLFNFNGSDGKSKYDDFHYKVICVTPAEMNTISTLAKLVNANVKDSEIALDLAERADMFYFHTWKSKSIADQDNTGQALDFYSKVVTRDNVIPQVSDMESFYTNDIEWDQVMKILKRSSNNKYGGNLPIIFNGTVAAMSEEAADPDSDKLAKAADDNKMYMYDSSEQDMNGLQWNGNMSNIMKLYQILIQFDLRAVKGVVINPDEPDKSKQVKIKRTFMKDIFPYLEEVDYSSSYTDNKKEFNSKYYATDKTRFEVGNNNTGILKLKKYSALHTGYVDDAEKALVKDTWGRMLASTDSAHGEQFCRNALYLWNKYTFYPCDTILENEMDFIAQGYLKSYYNNRKSIFSVTAGEYRYETGSDGMDDQNVYVFKIPGDEAGQHADSVISYMNSGDGTNTFLDIAYKILHNSTEPSDILIEAKPRNKVYTLLGNTFDTETKKTSSKVLMDYYSNPDLYTEEKLEDLKGLEKNIKMYVLNQNSESAVITRVELLNSRDETKTIAYIGDGSDTSKSLSEICNKNNQPGMSLKNCNAEGSKTPSKYGIEIEDYGELVFYVPYTLNEFFEGYDKIEINGYNWTRNTKTQEVKIEQFSHTVNILEREMSLLE